MALSKLFADFSRKHPRSPFKYLSNQYLVRDLSTSARASALTHHYAYLHGMLGQDSLRRILFDHVKLWEQHAGGCAYDVTLKFSTPVDLEGELSLSFQADGIEIFVLSFSVVPGWVPALPAESALLIARLQGNKGYFEQIRLATKALHEVSPQAVLVAAIQGIAEALAIRHMAGVSAVQQSSNIGFNLADFESAYDEFWISLGASKAASNFFHIPLPLPEKDIQSVKRNHRARTKLKRQFKKRIAEQVCQSFQRIQALRH